jgi:hypothetical protein
MAAKSRLPAVPERKQKGLGSAPDALRSAIEQTFEATAGATSQTRDRAAAIVNEITELGQEARSAIEKRSESALKLFRRRRKVAERAIDDVRGAIEQIQRRLRP